MSGSGLWSLSRGQRFLLLMALWTIFGLIDAGQFYVHLNYFKSRSIHWEEALASGLADWYVWALMAPFIFRLGRLFPVEPSNWPWRLALHLAIGTGFMLLKVAIDLPLAWVIHAHDALLGPTITGKDFSEAANCNGIVLAAMATEPSLKEYKVWSLGKEQFHHADSGSNTKILHTTAVIDGKISGYAYELKKANKKHPAAFFVQHP